MENERQAVIRKARVEDAPGIARVHVDSWRTTYAGLLPENVLAGLSYERRAETWRLALVNPPRGHCLFVAESGPGRIIGFATGGPERTGTLGYDGELYAIYLLNDFQGMGIGRQLLSAVAQSLAASGLKNLLAWVLETNPARGFYERLGGQQVAEKKEDIGGAVVTEIAYGWPDIEAFA